MVSTVWSVSCLLFFYSRCSPCPAICKRWGHVPPVPRRHWAHVSNLERKIALSSSYTILELCFSDNCVMTTLPTNSIFLLVSQNRANTFPAANNNGLAHCGFCLPARHGEIKWFAAVFWIRHYAVNVFSSSACLHIVYFSLKWQILLHGSNSDADLCSKYHKEMLIFSALLTIL